MCGFFLLASGLIYSLVCTRVPGGGDPGPSPHPASLATGRGDWNSSIIITLWLGTPHLHNRAAVQTGRVNKDELAHLIYWHFSMSGCCQELPNKDRPGPQLTDAVTPIFEGLFASCIQNHDRTNVLPAPVGILEEFCCPFCLRACWIDLVLI